MLSLLVAVRRVVGVRCDLVTWQRRHLVSTVVVGRLLVLVHVLLVKEDAVVLGATCPLGLVSLLIFLRVKLLLYLLGLVFGQEALSKLVRVGQLTLSLVIQVEISIGTLIQIIGL